MADTAFDDSDKKALDSFKDMSVGEILSKTRENYGLSLQDVSDRLKIRLAYLEALEKDDVSVLPGRVYAIGFVRSYADFLGLDGEKIVYLFKNQKVGHSKDTDYSMPTPLDDGQIPSIKIIIACAVILLIGFFLMNGSDSKKDTQIAAIPDVPQELVEEGSDEVKEDNVEIVALESVVQDEKKAIEQEKAELEEELESAVSEGQFSGLRIIAVEDSWVSIRDDDGNSLLAKLMREGDKFDLEIGKTAIMNTGNIGGLKFYINGGEVKVSGQRGEVRKNMEISVELLKNLQ